MSPQRAYRRPRRVINTPYRHGAGPAPPSLPAGESRPKPSCPHRAPHTSICGGFALHARTTRGGEEGADVRGCGRVSNGKVTSTRTIQLPNLQTAAGNDEETRFVAVRVRQLGIRISSAFNPLPRPAHRQKRREGRINGDTVDVSAAAVSVNPPYPRKRQRAAVLGRHSAVVPCRVVEVVAVIPSRVFL